MHQSSLLNPKSWLICLQTISAQRPLSTHSRPWVTLRVSLRPSLPFLQGMTPAEHPTPLKSSEEDVRPVSSCSNTPYPEAPSDHPSPSPL